MGRVFFSKYFRFVKDFYVYFFHLQESGLN